VGNLRLEVTNIKEFTALLDCVDIVGNTDIVIDAMPTHLFINQYAIDHTAIVIVHLAPEFFEGFIVEKEERVSVQLEMFQKTMKMFKNFKKMVFESDHDKAVLKLNSREGRKSKRTSLKLIDTPDYEAGVDISGLKFETIIKLKADEFKSALSDAKDVGDDVLLTYINGKLNAFTESTLGANEDEWTVDDMDVLISEKAGANFGIGMLQPIASKGNALSKSLTLSLGDNKPLKLVYNYTGGTLTYIIAPVINDAYTAHWETMKNA